MNWIAIHFQAALNEVAEKPLFPARMLNEFAYCPRLAYLEWVWRSHCEPDHEEELLYP